jgi:hypothetical protein
VDVLSVGIVVRHITLLLGSIVAIHLVAIHAVQSRLPAIGVMAIMDNMTVDSLMTIGGIASICPHGSVDSVKSIWLRHDGNRQWLGSRTQRRNRMARRSAILAGLPAPYHTAHGGARLEESAYMTVRMGGGGGGGGTG